MAVSLPSSRLVACYYKIKKNLPEKLELDFTVPSFFQIINSFDAPGTKIA
jgi:hypothetical protein